MYEIFLERRAERDLKALSRPLYLRVVHKIKTLAHNPRPEGCRKITGSGSDWRIRVGDYRVIYAIDDVSQTIKVMRVRHRREVYRT